MNEIIEMGTVSSKGQISIPRGIRKELNIKEGSKLLFLLSDNALLVKKVNVESFAQITKPLHAAKKKIEESQVNALIHKLRKKG